ncbi:hypothetical protein B0188_05175 [[Haemophilus] felis]|uniref:Uncharacterized protein n=1 Tax=[Haemophilus] felis TaxID=123822 RepID=A0A1T0B2B5_9PAST|nr:hypothetical protein B0188_05175 [[Haemophilus] felis]
MRYEISGKKDKRIKQIRQSNFAKKTLFFNTLHKVNRKIKIFLYFFGNFLKKTEPLSHFIAPNRHTKLRYDCVRILTK